MKTIKYCPKNDKLGTKEVYKALKKEYPDLKQKRKGCLSECRTCRKQPFVKIGKKQVVCGDSPEQLYEQLIVLIRQADSKRNEKTTVKAFDKKKEKSKKKDKKDKNNKQDKKNKSTSSQKKNDKKSVPIVA